MFFIPRIFSVSPKSLFLVVSILKIYVHIYENVYIRIPTDINEIYIQEVNKTNSQVISSHHTKFLKNKCDLEVNKRE